MPRNPQPGSIDDRVRIEHMLLAARDAAGFIKGYHADLDGRALGAIEIAPRGEFYDYRSKYQAGQSEYYFPARLSPPATAYYGSAPQGGSSWEGGGGGRGGVAKGLNTLQSGIFF